MTYYVPQPMPSTVHGGTNSVLPSPSTVGPNSNNIQLTGPPVLNNSSNVSKTTPVPAPNTSDENKTPNLATPSQPNVFQYPNTVTAASTSNYVNTSITPAAPGNGSQTSNQSAMIATPGRSHFSNSQSTATPNETSPTLATTGKNNPYNVGPHAHVSPPSSNHTSNSKNIPPLFPTPNNILTNGIVPHSNQDYHEASNSTSTYEHKKNQQNSNRKVYANGSYRPMMSTVNNNSSANYSSQAMHPPSSSGSSLNVKKSGLMPQPVDQNHQHTFNAGGQHNGIRTPPTGVAYNRNNTNNSHAEHGDKRAPVNTNSNRNNSHASSSGAASNLMHNKGVPLIPTLPVNVHTSNTFEQRPRGPRPKPLDLRRSTNSSTRNTPSTNSTESNNNNSPNSIVSNSIQHTAQQTPLYISRGAHSSLHHSTSNSLETAACSPLAYNPHSGMYVKLGGQAYIVSIFMFTCFHKKEQRNIFQGNISDVVSNNLGKLISVP